MFDKSRKTLRKWWITLSAGWLVLAFTLLMLSNLTSFLELAWLFKVYLWVSLGVSIATFLAYGWDKRAAQKEKPRIQEKTLHLMAIVGGWAGAILGQQFFHHKTQKIRFRLLLPVIAGVHLLVVLFVVIF